MRALAAVSIAAVGLGSAKAAACGCFASVSTVDPVVQAGERIVFARDGNQVTAYVQIAYVGAASDFGWLVPVPAVPTVKAGTDELFEVLGAATAPSFALTTAPSSRCRSTSLSLGCGGAAVAKGSVDLGAQDAGSGYSPLVLRDTTGPYEYAVLKADSMSEVQKWLADNRYFVPAATSDALAPYLRPGSFFLALKLRSGKTVGDLKPVVLQYTSDYPMIPLRLTAATAVPNMGVQVFVLGAARAVPRNFHHVQLNLLKLDWATAANYQALVTQAVGEAPKKHAFVTEYAGPARLARGQLAEGGRFATKEYLQALPDAATFVQELFQRGYTTRGTTELSASLMDELETQIPVPPAFDAHGLSRQRFFSDLAHYLSPGFISANPDLYAGWKGVSFDATTLGQAVWELFAQPVLDADALLEQHDYLTRLYTTLSPEDMTEDPTFGFNASLPAVEALQRAFRTNDCDGKAEELTASGYTIASQQVSQADLDAMPAAATVEQLPEEGPPAVVSHFELSKHDTPSGQGCAAADGAMFGALALLWLLVRRKKLT